MPSPVHPYSEYGVALRTLKSARSWLGTLLFICVIAQFIGFALLWWTTQPFTANKAAWKVVATRPSIMQQLAREITDRVASKTQPATQSAPLAETDADIYPQPQAAPALNIRSQWDKAYRALVPLTQLGSLIAVLSQAIIVFITLLVVLIAQAPGVAQVTKALIWSVLLLFMFLPWQYFFSRDFPIPGVIYGYSDMLDRISRQLVGEVTSNYQLWQVYGRFMLWPAIGLLVLLITSERFRAGVSLAIGHPLQSMLQPRGGPGSGIPPRPLPMPAEKKII